MLSKDAFYYYLNTLQLYATTFQRAVALMNSKKNFAVCHSASKTVRKACQSESLSKMKCMSRLVCQKCISWSWTSTIKSPHPIVEMSIALSFYEDLYYRISRLMTLYRGWWHTNVHSSSSKVSRWHRYSSTRKQRWKFGKICHKNFAQIQQFKLWNKFDKRIPGIKPALLWEFLTQMETTLWHSQAASTAKNRQIWLRIAQSPKS